MCFALALLATTLASFGGHLPRYAPALEDPIDDLVAAWLSEPEHPTGFAPTTFNGRVWDPTVISHKYTDGLLTPASPGHPLTSMSLRDLHPDEFTSDDLFAVLPPNHQAGVTPPDELMWEGDGYQLHDNQPSEPQRLELRDDLPYRGNLATSVQAGHSYHPSSSYGQYRFSPYDVLASERVGNSNPV
ncbi:hypothetical protein PCASD_09210 [Puccinia coronata f. sp. avenae]|uniref:Uncharacterized protein n=1 Tax=Puccinia coronata f. sp. avenae TaxID=200324 RepID=A0A2N5RW66_9BASI|nr:hypothetical protein PCASD_24939 [Puccinia coronata f. sp. avenae]PLW24534.1 hypothetical protein PCASD_09210 [Puccinia coronata f. sp. avenae]